MFVLRIDDTDLERSTKENEDGIRADLTWLGMAWDETFKQSEKFDRYTQAAEELKAKGLLYPCYETAGGAGAPQEDRASAAASRRSMIAPRWS